MTGCEGEDPHEQLAFHRRPDDAPEGGDRLVDCLDRCRRRGRDRAHDARRHRRAPACGWPADQGAEAPDHHLKRRVRHSLIFRLLTSTSGAPSWRALFFCEGVEMSCRAALQLRGGAASTSLPVNNTGPVGKPVGEPPAGSSDTAYVASLIVFAS